MRAYDEDLAYIHDAGFGHIARAAGKRLTQELRRRDFAVGLVVDLGCGSGIVSKILSEAGYDTLGIDISSAMVDLARRRVPQGEFRIGSLLTSEIPPCVAVAAVGECFNYLFDRQNNRATLKRLLRRIHAALAPKGVFLLDVATPGRAPSGGIKNFSEGSDWAVLYSAKEDRRKQTLTRSITTFRKTGEGYRRDHETHEIRLISTSSIVADLRGIGFRAKVLRGYVEPFVRGHRGILAVK